MERLDFVILYVIVMICFGITSTVFYPEQYGFDQSDYLINTDEYHEDRNPNLLDQIVGFFSGVVSAITTILQFLYACLTFNIPYIPPIIRLCMTVPFHAGMLYVIFNLRT